MFFLLSKAYVQLNHVSSHQMQRFCSPQCVASHCGRTRTSSKDHTFDSAEPIVDIRWRSLWTLDRFGWAPCEKTPFSFEMLANVQGPSLNQLVSRSCFIWSNNTAFGLSPQLIHALRITVPMAKKTRRIKNGTWVSLVVHEPWLVHPDVATWKFWLVFRRCVQEVQLQVFESMVNPSQIKHRPHRHIIMPCINWIIKKEKTCPWLATLHVLFDFMTKWPQRAADLQSMAMAVALQSVPNKSQEFCIRVAGFCSFWPSHCFCLDKSFPIAVTGFCHKQFWRRQLWSAVRAKIGCSKPWDQLAARSVQRVQFGNKWEQTLQTLWTLFSWTEHDHVVVEFKFRSKSLRTANVHSFLAFFSNVYIPLSYHVHPCPCFIQQIPRSQWWFLTECTTTVARSADLLATPSLELRFDLPELGPGSAENRRPSAQRVSTCSCCVWKTLREHFDS